MRLGGFRQAFLGLGVKPPYRLDSEQLLAIDEVTYAMSGVGLNGADYLIEIIADNDEDLWRVVDESIRPLPGVEQTWWASIDDCPMLGTWFLIIQFSLFPR